MADLFQRIEDRRDEWNVEVMVTFLEIYNEEIRDLLSEPGSVAPRGGLSIREDKCVKVVGLVELKPKSAEEVKEIVLQGNSRRTQSPTLANATSSRSHAVLQVHVTQSPRTAAITEQRTMATLSIIDLAGSERAAATTNMGQRMVEGANINKSLLALGNCINSLCESGGAVRHVPYRNSKLTRLLKFSLGGNCKTVMIVCVAPTSNHFDDTHNTLVYAERATKIKTRVVTRNVVNVDRHVGRYVEAINRLNTEIAELKAKLSGKNGAETEIARRKRAEANAEVERAKNDMKVKAEQTTASIVDGASCTGKMNVAKAKLAAIRARLTQIDAKASSGSLSADIEAERTLLQALAGPEEQAIKPDSALTVRLQRSSNSSAMFDATLRAVSERRSDKLDDVTVDNVKLDAKSRKAEMERVKAVEERDVMKGAVEDMAEVMVGLVGMLGRCTVLVGESSKILRGSMGGDGGAETIKRVAGLLESVREKNDETFKKLLGHSTEGYTIGQSPTSASTLDNLSGYGATFSRRVSSGPAVLQKANAARTSRRPSTIPNSLGPERRAHKSPRKSLRSSLTSQPYRRVSDNKKGIKSVQWRDEVGQGDLDDGGPKVDIAIAVTPATPVVDNEVSTASSSSTSTSATLPSRAQVPRTQSFGGMTRTTSFGGSESEWEDENDKTDDSVGVSFLSMSMPASTCDTSAALRPFGTGAKRPRPSRLDPSFLKSKSRGTILGSLAEGDESGTPSPERRHHPLSDMSMNQTNDGDGLHVPKRHGPHASPARRIPGTPRGGGMASGSGVGMGKSGSGRRRSNIGLTRGEKGRRRSSMIPQLSPPNPDGSTKGAKRLVIGSPGKKNKRVSLMGSKSAMGLGALRFNKANSSMVGSTSMANMSISAGMDLSADLSFNKSLRPTWR